MQAQEQDDRIEKEVKQRETRRSTQKSFGKLGYQIRGHVKPNSTKKLSLNRLDVQTEDGLWRTRKNLSKCWVCYGRKWNTMYALVLESWTKHMDQPPKNYCME
jgi:hypothetical protein